MGLGFGGRGVVCIRLLEAWLEMEGKMGKERAGVFEHARLFFFSFEGEDLTSTSYLDRRILPVSGKCDLSI